MLFPFLKNKFIFTLYVLLLTVAFKYVLCICIVTPINMYSLTHANTISG